MNMISIEKLDSLFKSYNYRISRKSNQKVRIYTLRYGMYHAAEIVLLDERFDASKIKSEYSELGYATEVKKLVEEFQIEEYLFEGFFIKTPLGNELKNRYAQFVNRQLKNLPDNSQYEYIQSSYDLLYQEKDGTVVENKNYNGVSDTTLINKINQLLTETKGAIFIIIEAAAGFGKTCTAYEVLNTFSTFDSKKLPFFTELSRNREARVFKHILLNEIDEQFPSGIKQNIVIEQIAKGRIPLIIDGFDELITKKSNKEEVESMLTTIVDLLKGDAKIIITSRKTAIFNSEEFLRSVYDTKNTFSLARFEIKEPSVENWLNNDRIDIIKSNNFPIDQISNPVLLAYIRNIPFKKLTGYLNSESDDSLIDKYIDYLLKREQTRQNLKLNKETQLRVFRKLLRLMTEFNITAESKDTIKDFIKAYNQKIIKETLKEYIPEEKPSVEEFVETLSNHVFLDRRPNGNIGFVNDFILGLLVGENLIYGKYEEHYSNFYEIIPQDFASKSLDAFKVQNLDKRVRLWEIYNSKNFDYDVDFFFKLDHFFLREFKRTYKNLYLYDISFSNISFDGKARFIESGFSNISFHNCIFNVDIFDDCSFHNCNFYDCSLIVNSKYKVFNDFGIYACTANNDFLTLLTEKLEQCQKKDIKKTSKLTEIIVLRNFFGVDGVKPRPRKISYIKTKLANYTSKEISKVLSALKNNEFLHFRDDIGFITKQGISYYKQNKS